ncbi:MAG: hypothetical protein MZV63_41860 [Marinilabiliales bacterium]|nr:hypothetical protein [Marinilabiliales bacterium]
MVVEFPIILVDSIYRFSNPALDSVNKTVYSIIEDCDHNIWFNCANYGLYKYDGFTFVNYSEESGLKTNYIQGLTTDNLGNPVIISNEGVDKYIVKDSSFEYYGRCIWSCIPGSKFKLSI